MTPADINAIRTVHARLAAQGEQGWAEAYRQDVGKLLAHIDALAAKDPRDGGRTLVLPVATTVPDETVTPNPSEPR